MRFRLRKFMIVVLIAFLVAKVTAVVLRGPIAIELDANQYWRLSTLVMQGDPLLTSAPIAYRTPGYPWFIAAVRSVAGPYAFLAISLIQAAMLAASFVIAGVLAKRITRLPQSLPITLLVSMAAISSATFVSALLSESLFVFLLMANLLALQCFRDRPSLMMSSWVAATFALTLLTRPIVLLIWIVHGVGAFWPGPTPRAWRPRLASIWIAPIILALIVGPWVARNQLMFGKPFVTEFVGRNLWIVTFQNEVDGAFDFPATPDAGMLSQRLDRVGMSQDRDVTWAVSEGLTRSGLDDAQTDQMMKRVAVDAIRTDPLRFIKYGLIRCVNFWRTRATDLPTVSERGDLKNQFRWGNRIPMMDRWIEHRASNSLMINDILMATTVISLLVLIWNRTSRWAGIWLTLVLGYFCVVTGLLEIPAYRYRMVVEPIVACVHGSAIAIVFYSHFSFQASGTMPRDASAR